METIKGIVPVVPQLRGKSVRGGFSAITAQLLGPDLINAMGRPVINASYSALAQRMESLYEAQRFFFYIGGTRIELGPQADEAYVRTQYLFAQTMGILDKICAFSDLTPWKAVMENGWGPVRNHLAGSITVIKPVDGDVSFNDEEKYLGNTFMISSGGYWKHNEAHIRGMLIGREYAAAIGDLKAIDGYKLDPRAYAGSYLAKPHYFGPYFVEIPKKQKEFAQAMVLTLLPVYDAFTAEARALQAAIIEQRGY